MRTIPALLAAATILVAAARPASSQSQCASPGDVVKTCAKAGAETTALAVADSSGETAAMPGCAQGMSSEIANRVGTPLPADYKEQIRSALGEIASSTSNPTAVRNAASCVE